MNVTLDGGLLVGSTMAIEGPPWYVDLVEDWFRHLARRGRETDPGGNTRRTYMTSLRALGRMLLAEGVTSSEQLTKQQLERWLDQHRQRLVPASYNLWVAVIRGLLMYAAAEDRPLSSPTLYLKLESLRKVAAEPKPLEREHLSALFAALAQRPRDLVERRDRALVLFLFVTGSRIGAALRIRRDQLRPDHSVDIIQKGGRPHRLVYGELTAGWIDDYLRARRDAAPWLWVSHVPGRDPMPLTPDQVRQLLTRLARRAGIPRFTPHQLRHSNATAVISPEVGGNPREAAAHLGHADMATIARYTRVREDRRHQLADKVEGLIPAEPRPLLLPRLRPHARRRPPSNPA